MFYPDELVEQVRSSVDIVDVVGSYVRLKKSGSNYFGLCPFHNEKTASFSVSQTKQIFYCFGCGTGGNVYSFLMQYENCTFPEAVKIVADRAGISLPEVSMSDEEKKAHSQRQRLLEINKTAAAFYYYVLNSQEGEPARRYFENRQISPELIKHFGLGYTGKYSNSLYKYLKGKGYDDEILKKSGLVLFDEKKGAFDRFWNRVMFPIMDPSNRVIGFGGRVMGDAKPKYLNSPESEIFDKSRNLYGLNFARTSRKSFFIACEGYMDVIAMHQAGFTNAVASLGTAFTMQHAMLLKRYTKEVRLAYDSDTAGVKAAMRAVPILTDAGLTVRIIHMDPYKDPDEFIKNLGEEEFSKRIDDAQSSFMFEVEVNSREYKMSDPEGRASFIKDAAKMLLRFPLDAERSVYEEAVSRTYGIDLQELKKLVRSYAAAMSPEQIKKLQAESDDDFMISENVSRTTVKNPQAEAQRLLLTWISERPDLIRVIKGIIGPDDFDIPPYHTAAEMIFEEYEKYGVVTPAKIISQSEDVDDQKEIAAVFNSDIRIDDDKNFQKAFNETVKRIRLSTLERAGRNITDISKLQQIISERNKLQNLDLKVTP